MPLADYESLVDNLVRDDSGKIAAPSRGEAIEAARQRYSKDRPRPVVVDLTAAGGNLVDLPAAWESDFSIVVAIERPVGRVPPVYLDGGSFRLYQTPTGTKLQLDAPASAGEQIRFTYTARHVLTAATDTVPSRDREAVAAWAAALLLDQLAAVFAGKRIASIAADAIDNQSKSAEYAQRAKDVRWRYFNELGIDPKRSAAAGAVVNLDPRDSLGQRDRLTHPAAYR